MEKKFEKRGKIGGTVRWASRQIVKVSNEVSYLEA